MKEEREEFSNSTKEAIDKTYSHYQSQDCFGYEYKKDNPKVYDHVYPLSKNGCNESYNGLPMSKIANEQKSDNLYGRINEHNFRVIKKELNGKILGVLEIDGEPITYYS